MTRVGISFIRRCHRATPYLVSSHVPGIEGVIHTCTNVGHSENLFLEIHSKYHKTWIISKWNQVMNISRVPNSRDVIWEFSSLTFRPNFINLSVLFRIPISSYYWDKISTLSKYKILMKFHEVSHEKCIYYKYETKCVFSYKIKFLERFSERDLAGLIARGLELTWLSILTRLKISNFLEFS